MKQILSPIVLENLRKEIRRLEGFKNETEAGHLPVGIPIGDSLPDSALALGAIHEFLSAGYEETAATTAFNLAILARSSTQLPLIWVARDPVQYAPGFAAYGIDARRIIFARPQKDAQALFVMEEALRCKGIAAVIGECATADLTATRRLQLAAEESGVPGLLLRSIRGEAGASSCATRWRIKPAPGETGELPGLGAQRWLVELLKARGGRPGKWVTEWKESRLSLVTPPQPVVAVLQDGPAKIVPFALRA